MVSGPQPMNHQQRLQLARTIVRQLSVRYSSSLTAAGLYGSVARGQDGPYSDIELFCVLQDPGAYRNIEWCAGPWKAEVNVRSETELRREAAQLDGQWALTHSAFVHILPLIDPQHYFAGLPALVMQHTPEDFQTLIRAELASEIYECVGKIRNALSQQHYQALPALAILLTQRTAYILGLEHRHLYQAASSLFDEALELPALPQGFTVLARLVMSGTLCDAGMVASACDHLWSGLVQWAAERGYASDTSQNVPD
jgi:kanamycin nucleotidyltransferase